MNIALSMFPENFSCEGQPGITPPAITCSVAEFRRKVVGSNEGIQDFRKRIEQIEEGQGVFVRVAQSHIEPYRPPTTAAYAIAVAEVMTAPDQYLSNEGDVDEVSTWEPLRLVAEELYVASDSRGRGVARLMLNKLAFSNSFGSKRAPVEMAMGDWFWDYPELETAFQSAGFVRNDTTGLMTIQLPGDFYEAKTQDERDRVVKEAPFGWSGVIEANISRREPGFVELYRNGDMLARMTEVDMPAGVAVELGGEPEGASQLVIPIDETSPTLDDLYRRVLLQILNDPEFPNHVGIA
jgi:GNAT superfamily N-acetyltransferase